MLPQKLGEPGKGPAVLLGEGPVTVAFGKEVLQGGPGGLEVQAQVVELVHEVDEAEGVVLVVEGF